MFEIYFLGNEPLWLPVTLNLRAVVIDPPVYIHVLTILILVH